MDFYRINEEYNRYLQTYEKEKKEGLPKFLILDMLIEISLHSELFYKFMA